MTSSSASTDLHAETLDWFIEEVREFIDSIHRPRLSDTDWAEVVRQKGHEIHERMSKYTHAFNERHAATYESMAVLLERVREYTDELSDGPSAQGLREHGKRLARSYEEFLLEMKQRRVAHAAALTRSRQLKPINLARNAFHAGTGLFAIACYWFLFDRTQALLVLAALLAVFGSLEISRLFSKRWNDFLVDRVFGAISRPSERYRVNSATVLLSSMIIVVALFPKAAVMAAILVVSIGDPVASLAGKRWGRHKKLYRDKSYAGTMAFFVASFVGVAALLLAFTPDIGVGRLLMVAAALAAVGAVTEVFSSRIDDNLSIPIACAAVGTLLLQNSAV